MGGATGEPSGSAEPPRSATTPPAAQVDDAPTTTSPQPEQPEPLPAEPPEAPPPPPEGAAEGGVYVLLDGEYVYIPPDSDCRPHTSSAAGGYIGEGSASASEPVLSVLAAQRELRAAVSLYKVIGRRAQPQIQAKTLQLADALFAAGATPNAEALYQSVFEWAGADYGGRSELAQRAAQGLARVYRARGEDAKAEWVLRKPDPTPLELLEGAWGCVAGALAQVPGALEGLARAVVPQQAGPERPPAEPASASAL